MSKKETFQDWTKRWLDRVHKIENDYYEKTGNVKPTSECLEEARIQLEKEDK